MAISWIGGPTEREQLAKAGILISIYEESVHKKYNSDRWFRKYYPGYKNDPTYIEKRKTWLKNYYQRNKEKLKAKRKESYHIQYPHALQYKSHTDSIWNTWVRWIRYSFILPNVHNN